MGLYWKKGVKKRFGFKKMKNGSFFWIQKKVCVCVCTYVYIWKKYICVMKNDLLHHNDMLRAFVSYHGRS